jgi:hypothetical protein
VENREKAWENCGEEKHMCQKQYLVVRRWKKIKLNENKRLN